MNVWSSPVAQLVPVAQLLSSSLTAFINESVPLSIVGWAVVKQEDDAIYSVVVCSDVD